VDRPPDVVPPDLAASLHRTGARVPAPWLAGLLEPPHGWLPAAGAPDPISGRPTTPHRFALTVFQGLLAACGARTGARARAVAYDLAAAVAPVGVRGAVARRPVPDAVEKSAWVRALQRGARAGEAAAACLVALEGCGALLRTPAMVEQARWRLGPGFEVSDAQAIATAVADVVWRSEEDAGALLRAVAGQAGRAALDVP
jgi:hypothetical protein